jgi:hypothetical protein
MAYVRWPRSQCNPGTVGPEVLAYPGKDGAETGVILETLREGLQESEATVLLDEAVARHSARLGPELEAKCRQALRGRYDLVVGGLPRHGCVNMTEVGPNPNHFGWQDVNRRLFAAAAEVSRKPGT